MPNPDLTQALNSDTIDLIYSLCDVPTLRSLRLLNQLSNDIASRYLFRSVILRPRKQRLDELVRISQNDTFAKGVREIVWETAQYFDPLSSLQRACGRKELPGSDQLSMRSRQRIDNEADSWRADEEVLTTTEPSKELAAALAEPDQLREQLSPRMDDEAGSWRADEEVLTSTEPSAELVAALTKFTGLKRVTLVSWARPTETLKKLWEEDGYDPDSEDGKPGSLPIFFNRGGEYERQTRAFSFLFSALGAAARSIESLEVRATMDDDISGVLLQRERAGPPDDLNLHMLFLLQDVPDNRLLELTQPLRNLRQLHLRLTGTNSIMVQACMNGKFAMFLSLLPNVENLAISLEGLAHKRMDFGDGTMSEMLYLRLQHRFLLAKFLGTEHVFRRLRRLELRLFWLEASELCDVLGRHAATLEEVVLGQVLLGDTAPPCNYTSGFSIDDVSITLDMQKPSDDYWIDFWDEKETYKTAEQGPAISLPEWDQVVLVCQSLPMLKGVEIQAPMEYTVRCKSTVAMAALAALEERAMKGRPNSLIGRD